MAENSSWTFYGYRTAAGRREVQVWFAGLHEDEKDEIRDTLGYLKMLPAHLWEKPEFYPLGDGLFEIRLKVNTLRKIYRIYGCFWPKDRRFSFTLLLGAEKKVSNQKHEVAEARKRKARLEGNEASIHEFEF